MSEDLRRRLRASGYRLTPQRELIIGAVERLEHATPDEVYDEVRASAPAVNISTVYRTLEMLEELGLVRHTHLSDRAPTYHAVTGAEHLHLVCRNCRRVSSVDPVVIEASVTRLREELGFEPDVGHLTIFGRCTRCEDHSEGDEAT